MHLGPLVRAVCRATVRLAVCGEYAPPPVSLTLSHFGTSVIYIYTVYLYPRAQRRTSYRHTHSHTTHTSERHAGCAGRAGAAHREPRGVLVARALPGAARVRVGAGRAALAPLRVAVLGARALSCDV